MLRSENNVETEQRFAFKFFLAFMKLTYITAYLIFEFTNACKIKKKKELQARQTSKINKVKNKIKFFLFKITCNYTRINFISLIEY